MPSNMDDSDSSGNSVVPAFLRLAEAALYLGVSPRWLEGNSAIPRVNVAKPGSNKAMWRYGVDDLNRYVEDRRPPNGRAR